MAVFFRIKLIDSVFHVRIRAWLLKLNIDITQEPDGLLIVSKRRKYKLNKKAKSNREIPSSNKPLVTLLRENSFIKCSIGKHLVSLTTKNELLQLIIIFALIKNTRGAFLKENPKKSLIFYKLPILDINGKVNVNLHFISIISYLFKILTTSKIKGEI